MCSGNSLLLNYGNWLFLSGWSIGRRALLCCVLLAHAVTAYADLDIQRAWVKLAPPGSSVNAAYMTLANTGNTRMVITQVKADCCSMTMLHRTRQQAGSVTMEHLDELVLPPHSRIELAPGGLHIMLMRMNAPLLLNHQVNLQLVLSDGQKYSLSIPVLREWSDAGDH